MSGRGKPRDNKLGLGDVGEYVLGESETERVQYCNKFNFKKEESTQSREKRSLVAYVNEY